MTCPKCGGTRSTCYVCHGSAITADQMRYVTQGIDIRKWRMKCNLNARDAAAKLGSDYSTVLMAEDGSIDNDFMVKAIRRACA